MNVHLISAIIKGLWAIDPEAALSYAPLLNNLIGEGMKLEFSFDGQQFNPYAVGAVAPIMAGKWTSWEDVPEGSIAVIPLKGPLMKADQYCGPIGMASIGQIIKKADDSRKIDSIIFDIDSPGGTVDGTVALAEIIANVKKPNLTFANGQMGSGGLWIGSHANEVIAADNKTQIGSVGVILSFADLQPAYEKLGVKFHNIVSNLSPDKNKMFEMIREGKYDEYKKEVLDPLATDFQAAIKKNRPNVKDDQLTGKVYFAENLVGTMIDSIGNFDYAIERARVLAEDYKRKTSSNSNSNTQTAMKKQYSHVNAILGVEKLEATEEGVFLNEDQLQAMDTRLEKAGQDETALATAVQDKEKAEQDLATAQQSITEKDAEIADLKKNAGAESAKVIAETDPKLKSEKSGNITSEKKSFMENLDAVSEEFGL